MESLARLLDAINRPTYGHDRCRDRLLPKCGHSGLIRCSRYCATILKPTIPRLAATRSRDCFSLTRAGRLNQWFRSSMTRMQPCGATLVNDCIHSVTIERLQRCAKFCGAIQTHRFVGLQFTRWTESSLQQPSRIYSPRLRRIPLNNFPCGGRTNVNRKGGRGPMRQQLKRVS